MLSRLKQTVSGQLLLLVACAALAYGVSFAFGYRPLLRLTFTSAGHALRAGLGLIVLRLLIQSVMMLAPFDAGRASLRRRADNARLLTPFGVLGAAISGAFGEELFLRGYLFGAFASQYFWLALAGTMILSVFLYLDRSFDWSFSLGIAADAIFLALIFDRYRSLALIVLARLIADIASSACLRHPKTGAMLAVRKPRSFTLYWRQLYAASFGS